MSLQVVIRVAFILLALVGLPIRASVEFESDVSRDVIADGQAIMTRRYP